MPGLLLCLETTKTVSTSHPAMEWPRLMGELLHCECVCVCVCVFVRESVYVSE